MPESTGEHSGNVVGSATVALNMATGGFEAAGARIRKHLQAIRGDIAAVQNRIAKRGGLMGPAELTASLNQLQKLSNELRQTEKQVRLLTNSGQKFQSGLRQIRSGMSQAAIVALGTRSAFGQIAQGLFLLGPGEGAIIAFAAGMAAIGFGLDRIKKKLEEARDRANDFAKTARSALTGIITSGAGKSLADQLAAANREWRLTAINTQAAIVAQQGYKQALRETLGFAGLLARQMPVLAGLIGLFTRGMREQFVAIDHVIANLEGQLANAERAHRQMVAQLKADAVKRFTDAVAELDHELALTTLKAEGLEGVELERFLRYEAFKRSVEVIKALGKAALLSAEQIQIALDDLTRAFNQSEEAIAEGRLREMWEKATQDFIDQSNKAIKKIRDDVAREKQEWVRIGERVGRDIVAGLVEAIFEGAITVGQALKRMLLAALASIGGQLLGKAIGGLFGGIFSIGKPSTDASWVGDASIGRLPSSQSLALAGTRGTIVVPVSGIPPNPSPIAMARDRQWLALVSETQRVAPQLGIRMVTR